MFCFVLQERDLMIVDKTIWYFLWSPLGYFLCV